MNYTGPGWWPDRYVQDCSDPDKILPQTPDHDKRSMRQPAGERRPLTPRQKATRKRRRQMAKASRKNNR